MKTITLVRKSILILFVSAMLFSCKNGEQKKQGDQTRNEQTTTQSRKYSTWMADSEIKRNPKGWTLDFNEKPKWEYTHGLIMTSMEKLYKQTGDEKYLDYIKNFADFMVEQDGSIKTYKQSDYNIDRVQGGRFLIGLYKETGTEKYKKAFETLRDQMRDHPRTTEGGFWHKKVYPHQIWLDGLYMGSPFLARYAKNYNEPELFDDVANQIRLVNKYHYSQQSGLFHHAWDESKEQRWSDSQTGLSTNYWGRSIGWLSMALVDVLDFLPVDHPERENIIQTAQKLADGVLKYQDETGAWYQVIDQAEREGNYLEGSVTSMLSYFLLKGADKGYLSEKHRQAGIKAYKGLLDELIRENEDGTISLTQVNGVSGLGGDPYRDGSYEYYINEIIRADDPKGVGPFILASIYYENLNQ